MSSRFVLATPRPRAAGGTPPRIVPLQDETAHAVVALAVGSTMAPLVEKASGPLPTGPMLREDLRELARGTAARILDAAEAPSDEALAEMAEELLETLALLLGKRAPRAFPDRLGRVPREGLELAGQALRDQALDHHASELMLATRDREHVAACAPVTEAQAHVWLLDPLYRRLETWVAADATTRLEREAARWWLDRWRSPRPLAGDAFPRGVREQEFSLVERTYSCLGASPLEYVVEDDGIVGAGPRQLHLARQMVESRAGVWTVERRIGDDVVFRDPLDGTRFPAREHAEEHEYGAGTVALGRLIPFGDGTWLRSPGTLVIPDGQFRPGFAEGLAKMVEMGSEQMYRQACVEAAIHTIREVRGLPRAVRVPFSPDQAARVLRDLHQGLHRAGAAEAVAPDQVPELLPDARELAQGAAPADATLLRCQVDVVLADYIGVLFPLSRKSRAVREALRRREREAKEGKEKGEG